MTFRMIYFPNLRVYFEYDFLNSNINLKNYFLFLQKNQISQASLITTNSLFGIREFYQKALSYKIKPIIGLTLSNFRKEEYQESITLFPKNFHGYQKILSISSQIMLKNNYLFTQKQDYSAFQNLIVVIHINNMQDIKRNLSFFFSLKKKRVLVFFGISDKFKDLQLLQDHDLSDWMVAFNTVRYLFPEEIKIYQVLKAIKQQKKISEWDKNHLHFLSYDELKKNFLHDYLIQNTNKIFDNIELVIPEKKNWNLKKFPLPAGFLNASDYLKFICEKRTKELKINKINYQKRLLYELKIIQQKELVNYFLLVYDYVDFALKKNILVGPGRGSSAGSLVAYLLKITKVDPIKYDLIFERFLNPKRTKLPDIDLDFEDQKRNQILKYLINKYGTDYVAQIATFQKIGFKMAIRDVGRVLNIPLVEINQINKQIPLECNNDFNLALKSNLFLQSFQKRYSQLFEFAQKLIGLPRQAGIHAAGIVIANEKLIESVALWKDDQQNHILQAEMTNLENLKLIKMDLLGLRNLTIIGSVLDEIGKGADKNKFLDQIDLEDQITFQNLRTGNTYGIFQLESSGMTQLLKKIQPRNIDEIALIISLYRPGPMKNVDELIKRKTFQQKKTFLTNDFNNILNPTYGIPVYQEQIIKMVQIFSNLSLADAEILRQAMSKKKIELINSIKDVFFKEAKNKGHKISLVEEVWNVIFEFAGYGFNRSHAISYSLIVYWMVYLKTHHFFAFMMYLLNDTINDLVKTKNYLSLWRQKEFLDLFVFSINFSELSYKRSNKNKKLYLPFVLIKYIGKTIAQKIITERHKSGFFKDIYDFFARVILLGVNKASLSRLIFAGALDEFGYNRTTLFFNLDKLILIANFVVVKEKEIDWSLLPKRPSLEKKQEEVSQILTKELETLGFICNYQELLNFREKHRVFLKQNNFVFLQDIANSITGGYFKVCVVIEKISKILIKKTQKEILLLEISDENKTLKVSVWSQSFQQNHFHIGQIIGLEISSKIRKWISKSNGKEYQKKVFYFQKILLK